MYTMWDDINQSITQSRLTQASITRRRLKTQDLTREDLDVGGEIRPSLTEAMSSPSKHESLSQWWFTVGPAS